MTIPCTGGLCADALTCLGACGGDATCPRTHWCDAIDGGCVPDLDPGEPCDRLEMCASGVCIDGVCCDGGCDGPCTACDLAGTEGTCTPHAQDTDPEGDCTAPEMCGPDGECYVPTTPDAGVLDAGMADGGGPDAAAGTDAGSRDASASDAGTSDPDGLVAHGSSCLCRAPGALPSDRAPTGVFVSLLVALAVFARRGARRRR
jgi:hypothetical protein